MKLRYSPTSPYVRKVMVCAIELDLDDRIERVPTNPWSPETDLPADNPLGKVPALVTDDDTTLFDSPVICEYLASLSDRIELFPPTGRERWVALRLHALSDGLMDAAVARLLESRRPDGERSEGWIARQRVVVERALDALEHQAPSWRDLLTIGHVAAGCALGYLDFRFSGDGWRERRHRLAEWYRIFSERSSMRMTVPRDPGKH